MLLVVAGLVQAGREDGLDGPVAQRADVQRAAAGGVQAFGGVGAQQLYESEAAAVALFGVGPALEEPFDEGGRVGSGLAAPGDEPRRCPFRMGAGSVAYPPFLRIRRCAVTLRCLWKISTVVALRRTSTSRRASG